LKELINELRAQMKAKQEEIEALKAGIMVNNPLAGLGSGGL
jgi:hypothetical protein